MPDATPFVPDGFEPPSGLTDDLFVLEPLGPQHTESDYDAWTSSMQHIGATPGFIGGSWPRDMTVDENRADLERHARDFAARTGFTYTVLEPGTREVVGCVYIYPSSRPDRDADVRLWVRASRAELDEPLWHAVRGWLDEEWPFAAVDDQGRG
jgi:hypothetical protein